MSAHVGSPAPASTMHSQQINNKTRIMTPQATTARASHSTISLEPIAAPSSSSAQPNVLNETSRCGRRRIRTHDVINGMALVVSLLVKLAAAEESTFTGEWNGEWKASSNGDIYDDDVVRDENRVYSMWKDDDDYESKMSTDDFIMYATAIILSTLTLLFCLCHPEIPIVICMKLKDCCCRSFQKKGGDASKADQSGDEYMGGIQMEKRQDENSEREVI